MSAFETNATYSVVVNAPGGRMLPADIHVSTNIGSGVSAIHAHWSSGTPMFGPGTPCFSVYIQHSKYPALWSEASDQDVPGIRVTAVVERERLYDNKLQPAFTMTMHVGENNACRANPILFMYYLKACTDSFETLGYRLLTLLFRRLISFNWRHMNTHSMIGCVVIPALSSLDQVASARKNAAVVMAENFGMHEVTPKIRQSAPIPNTNFVPAEHIWHVCMEGRVGHIAERIDVVSRREVDGFYILPCSLTL